MHNKFSKDKIKVSDLKKTVDYSSAGGIYSALESKYLEKDGEEIRLTDEGRQYVKERILPEHNIYKSYGNVLVILGFFFIFQWFEWTYLNVPIIPTWYFALLIVGAGIFLHFFTLRFNYFITRKMKRLEH